MKLINISGKIFVCPNPYEFCQTVTLINDLPRFKPRLKCKFPFSKTDGPFCNCKFGSFRRSANKLHTNTLQWKWNCVLSGFVYLLCWAQLSFKWLIHSLDFCLLKNSCIFMYAHAIEWYMYMLPERQEREKVWDEREEEKSKRLQLFLCLLCVCGISLSM